MQCRLLVCIARIDVPTTACQVAPFLLEARNSLRFASEFHLIKFDAAAKVNNASRVLHVNGDDPKPALLYCHSVIPAVGPARRDLQVVCHAGRAVELVADVGLHVATLFADSCLVGVCDC